MSTKTLRKRIALATVVALGAGVLSLVSTTAANAYTGANDNSWATRTASSSTPAAANVLNIGTAVDSTGSAIIPGTGTSGTPLTGSTASSVGLVNVSDIAGGLAAGTTQTATLLSTGSMVVYTSSTTVSKNITIVVTGGTLAANTSSTLVTSIASNLTSIASASAGIGLLAVKVTPNSGATSMIVSMYDNGSTAASTSSPTSGTLYGQITVTIATSSTAGKVSTAKSGVYYAHAAAGVSSLTSDDTTTATEANPNGGTGAYGILQYANIRVRDAYGTAITDSNGLLTATATNGAYVNIGTGATTATQSSAYYPGSSNSGVADNLFLTVKNPTTAPLTTVVTVSHNGTVIGTKSFTFTGQIAKVTLSAASNGLTGSTATSTIAFADAAGNAVYPSTTSTAYPSTSVTTDGDTLNQYVISGAVQTQAGGLKLWPTSSTAGVYDWTCVSSAVGAGSANVGVIYTNADGSVVKSNALKVTCSGAAYTYTAALDKATYAPGDIAKLTVTFKDSKGNLAADGSTIASSTYKPSLSGGNLSLIGGSAVDTGNATDSLSNGVITYKFTVGAPTVDPYGGQLVVSFGAVNSADQGAITVGYKIASGSTSLNDVLKGIVSLIASINKQIAALAKLVTKKK